MSIDDFHVISGDQSRNKKLAGIKPFAENAVLGNRIVIAPATDDKIEGGVLYRPSSAEDAQAWGDVVAVGESYPTSAGWRDPSVKAGDRVFYNTQGAGKIRIDGIGYLVVRNEDVVLRRLG